MGVLCHSAFLIFPNIENTYPADVNEEILKELPHVIACINLFHFNFCVYIAMI